MEVDKDKRGILTDSLIHRIRSAKSEALTSRKVLEICTSIWEKSGARPTLFKKIKWVPLDSIAMSRYEACNFVCHILDAAIELVLSSSCPSVELIPKQYLPHHFIGLSGIIGAITIARCRARYTRWHQVVHPIRPRSAVADMSERYGMSTVSSSLSMASNADDPDCDRAGQLSVQAVWSTAAISQGSDPPRYRAGNRSIQDLIEVSVHRLASTRLSRAFDQRELSLFRPT